MKKTLIIGLLVLVLLFAIFVNAAGTGTTTTSASKKTGKELLKAKTRAEFTKIVNPIKQNNATTITGPKYYTKSGSKTNLPDKYKQKKTWN